ncbi:MAG TPA: nucleotide exchange factor GrpE [Anaerolineae bacterium]|nr:nucleotide exchange factor GrpE [Anaerolineae bacterium]
MSEEVENVLEPEEIVADLEGVEVVGSEDAEEEVEETTTELSFEEKLAAAEAKAAENLEGWQRSIAELANARKRFNTQTQASYQNATIELVKKLLPVLDDLDRAMANAPEAIATDDWFKGIELLPRKINNIFEGLKIERIEALGQPFDPNFHEAISMEPSDEYESGHVVRELLPGYKVGDRVIRASLVYVAA